jgi:Zn finger protein HypA/HybF involved in hydrogenase expression
MGRATDEQLRPYGFEPGKFKRWCATCANDYQLGEKAFKCRRCAEQQFKEVERLCRFAGYGEEA